MKTLLFLLVGFLTTITLFAQNPQQLDVHFDENLALTEASIEDLEAILQTGKTKTIAKITVECFPKVNRQRERIAVLNDFLQEFDKEVDIIVFYEENDHLYFDPITVKEWNFLRLNYHYAEVQNYTEVQRKKENLTPFAAEYQVNIINASVANSLYLDKGCIIRLPAKSLVDKNGNLVEGNVKIKSREILDKGDLLLTGVSTNVEGGFLESRGMVEVLAETMEGEPLELGAGKSMEVNIPNRNKTIIKDPDYIVRDPEAGTSQATEQDFEIYKGRVRNGIYQWLLDTVKLVPNFIPPSPPVPVEVDKDAKVWKSYEWREIPAEQLDSMQQVRTAKIAYWEEKNRNNIKSTLKNYKVKARQEHRKNRKRGIRRSYRNLEVVKTRMIMGEATYRWTFVPPEKNSGGKTFRNSSFSQFRTYSLGMWNIDRMYKVPGERKDLLAFVEGDAEVKLLFKEAMVLINGEKEAGKTVFGNIPMQTEKLVFATARQEGERVYFGYKLVTSGQDELTIEMETLTYGEYQAKVKKLIAQFQ